MKIFRIVFFAFIFLAVPVTVFLVWTVKDQGASPDLWQAFPTAKVVFDEDGIPTIEAKNWSKLIEAQGYVVASERLWQMDLMRRSGAGRLSEWFGEETVARDSERLKEDWNGVASRAALLLDPEDRQFCELYANGVNRFINDHKNSWGVEYSLLRVKPEPWQCRDTLLIYLSMIDELTGGASREANEYRWQTGLTPEWRDFLFPKYHPWAKPLFGAPASKAVQFPPPEQFMPMEKIEPLQQAASKLFSEAYAIGSNGWVWSKPSGQTFLANDPHLGTSVPQLWYANRLRISPESWVVGVSIPGIPGIILGMNQSYAWGFTNVGEDVDDYLEEKLDGKKEKYLALKKEDKEFWRRIIKKKFSLKVKGRDEPVEVDAWFTHRGPLSQRKMLGSAYYSHQWLGYRDGIFKNATIKINRGKNWNDFNTGYDQMLIPAQAALYADRLGNAGLRITGVGVVRSDPERWLTSGTQGEWIGLKPLSERKRVLLSPEASADTPRFIGNANGQLWEDQYGERWYSEDRRDRIDSVLGAKIDQTQKDMSDLQMDTYSRFHLELVQWILVRLSEEDKSANLATVEQWRSWSGFATDNSRVFTQASMADEIMMSIFLARVRKAFYAKTSDLPAYEYRLRRGWVVAMLNDEAGFQAFGIDPQDLAHVVFNEVITQSSKKDFTLYPQANHWRAQHAFVGIPLLGRLFRVRDYPQTGFANLVKCEQPYNGPSFRAVWNLSDFKQSTWSFPVGQSGHLRSIHYRDLQKRWFNGQQLKVFDQHFEWN